ncbi:hypothetical protein BC830DRAFT_1170351 [Chytriomyces sp. MP71]|nr:hypothetical protein BC830DRAFT_1170351 [Chytriomyces sp. MP71]
MSTQTLASAIESACSSVFAPTTLLAKHWVGTGDSFTLPTGSTLQSKLAGLNAARALFPNTLTSNSELIAFTANILFESVCLTTLIERQCVQDPSRCTQLYGGSFWGRGYVQLTGQANYASFAAAVNRPDILQNPDLVATDETLAWASAVWFWSRSCNGDSNVGSGLRCINGPECDSATSSIYFQFAPRGRLLLAEGLAGALGVDADVSGSVGVCTQMGVSEQQGWTEFCQYHGSGASVNCGAGAAMAASSSAPNAAASSTAPNMAASPSIMVAPSTAGVSISSFVSPASPSTTAFSKTTTTLLVGTTWTILTSSTQSSTSTTLTTTTLITSTTTETFLNQTSTATAMAATSVLTSSTSHSTHVTSASPSPSPVASSSTSASPEINQGLSNAAAPSAASADKGLSGGAIAGIVLGVLAAVGIVATTAVIVWKRRQEGAGKMEGKEFGAGGGGTFLAAH